MIQTEPSTTCLSFYYDDLPVDVTVSQFHGDAGVTEHHVMARPTRYAELATQLGWLSEAYGRVLESLGLGGSTCVFRRVFCSDLSNQADELVRHRFADPQELCATSLVRQPPMPPAKASLWAYHIEDPARELQKEWRGGCLLLSRGELGHIWTTGLRCTASCAPYDQTKDILEAYRRDLYSFGLSLADNVIRTWFFVQGVDTNYGGLVKARRDVFAQCGLTPDTHFIASTGIEGTSDDLDALVAMDAYAIAGVRPEQISFLYALDYLSPTYVYGVTFERGVSVAYQDRKHILISGTASIDASGAILHIGDVLRQLDRTLINVEALLREADAELDDVCVFIVYVRDPSDMEAVRQVMTSRFPNAPVQVVLAPVCRPGWLVEIECQAIVSASNPALPSF